MTTPKKEILNHYINAGKLLCKLIGSNLEIVIQEGPDKDAPVQAIFKGENHLIKNCDICTDTQLLDHYNRSSKKQINNSKNHKVKTLEIKDNNNKVVGLFTIHWLMENTHQVLLLLNRLCNQKEEELNEDKIILNNISPEKEIKTFIKQYVNKNKSKVLKKREHIELIRQLYNTNFFAKKHSIRIAAMELGLAQVTIYKYISDFKKENYN